MKNSNAKIEGRSDAYAEELIRKRAGTYSGGVISGGADTCGGADRAISQIQYAKQLEEVITQSWCANSGNGS